MNTLFLATFWGLVSFVAGFNLSNHDNVAIYWGQNTLGYLSNFKNKEKDLWWYCNWDSVDVVLLAFVHSFPGTMLEKHNVSIPTISFAHHSEFLVNKTSPMKNMERDIKYCQSKGKKVLLSLGGQGGEYGFSSVLQAEEFGHTLWSMVGENHNKTIPRPFGNAIVDGFDFDIENSNTLGYPELVSTLQSYTNNSTKKEYYYAAAPQCVFPDAHMNTLMSESHLDMIFVQFYNNPCNANLNGSFNWNTWATFANNTPLFLGLPGSINSSSTGYIDTSAELQSLILGVANTTNLGGVMLWEASTAFSNRPKDSKNLYPDTIKNILLSKVDGKDVKINGADNVAWSYKLALVSVLVTVIIGY